MVQQGRNARADQFWYKSIPERSDLQLSTILDSSLRAELKDPRITGLRTRTSGNGFLKGGLGSSFSPAEMQARASLRSPGQGQVSFLF